MVAGRLLRASAAIEHALKEPNSETCLVCQKPACKFTEFCFLPWELRELALANTTIFEGAILLCPRCRNQWHSYRRLFMQDFRRRRRREIIYVSNQKIQSALETALPSLLQSVVSYIIAPYLYSPIALQHVQLIPPVFPFLENESDILISRLVRRFLPNGQDLIGLESYSGLRYWFWDADGVNPFDFEASKCSRPCRFVYSDSKEEAFSNEVWQAPLAEQLTTLHPRSKRLLAFVGKFVDISTPCERCGGRLEVD